VHNGDGGYAFPVGDTTAMAKQAVALLRDPSELARQKQLARRRAIDNFSTAPVVDVYEALYRRLLAPGTTLG